MALSSGCLTVSLCLSASQVGLKRCDNAVLSYGARSTKQQLAKELLALVTITVQATPETLSWCACGLQAELRQRCDEADLSYGARSTKQQLAEELLALVTTTVQVTPKQSDSQAAKSTAGFRDVNQNAVSQVSGALMPCECCSCFATFAIIWRKEQSEPTRSPKYGCHASMHASTSTTP